MIDEGFFVFCLVIGFTLGLIAYSLLDAPRSTNLLEGDFITISKHNSVFDGRTGFITSVSGDDCFVELNDCGCDCNYDEKKFDCKYVKRIKQGTEE